MALGLSACEAPPDTGEGPRPDDTLPSTTIRLLPEGQANLLVPIQLGLDSVGRRLYVSSNGMPTLAVVDIDAAALVAVFDLPAMPALHPLVAADEGGSVWLGFSERPALARLDPATGAYEEVESTIVGVHALVSVSGGGAVAAGHAREGEGDELVGLFTATAPVSLSVAGSVLGLDTATAGGVNALIQGADAAAPEAMVTLNGATLEETARCAIAPDQGMGTGFSWFDELPGVGFALAHSTSVGVLACSTGTWTRQTIGSENRSTFGMADGTFMVLDRTGGQSKNWGLARFFDAAVQRGGPPIQLGKNSGYAARDPQTGLVWMNSEGTGEVWAFRPETGEVEHKVPLGAHVESLVLDPSDLRRAVFTGRLTSSIGSVNLETGEVQVVAGELTWPVSPTWLDGRLYVLEDLTGLVAELDPATLLVIRTLDSGLGPNPSLTLSDLAADPERGWLIVSNGGEGTVAAVQADNGDLAGTWTFLGPPASANTPGRLELLAVAEGLVALRNSDGAMVRLDPASGELTFAQADAAAVRRIVSGHVLDSLILSEDGNRVWAGRWAFDPLTLQSVRMLDTVAQVLHDAGSDGLIGWLDAPAQALRLDEAGVVLSTVSTRPAPWGFPGLAFRDDGGDQGILLGSYDRGDIQYVSLDPAE